jgi:hypothetical protein
MILINAWEESKKGKFYQVKFITIKEKPMEPNQDLVYNFDGLLLYGTIADPEEINRIINEGKTFRLYMPVGEGGKIRFQVYKFYQHSGNFVFEMIGTIDSIDEVYTLADMPDLDKPKPKAYLFKKKSEYNLPEETKPDTKPDKMFVSEPEIKEPKPDTAEVPPPSGPVAEVPRDATPVVEDPEFVGKEPENIIPPEQPPEPKPKPGTGVSVPKKITRKRKSTKTTKKG